MSLSSRTRIIFVDDEPVILELLQLSLSSMKGEWEATMAQSAEEVLALMEKNPADVVVSDMNLPGMSGGQLLNEIMRRYPATIRIILSGYGDTEQVMRCVGATHQFLAKPFKLSELKAALKRIRGLKDRIASPEIRKVVARKEYLPTLPAVYFRILEALQEAESSVETIAKAVATDPGLTTKILQLVNSAFLGYGGQVSSAEEAILLLGTGTIRSLALTLRMFSAFDISQPEKRSLERVWNHSVRVGRLAQRIAKVEGGDDKLAEEAFTAGLLHDIGKLALADNSALGYVELMARAEEVKRPLIEIEREAFQATHAEVGAYLLDLWGLPLPLVEAVALHHEPGKTDAPCFNSLTAVHVANALESEASMPESLSQGLDLQYLDRLGLQSRLDAWRAELSEI